MSKPAGKTGKIEDIYLVFFYKEQRGIGMCRRGFPELVLQLQHQQKSRHNA